MTEDKAKTKLCPNRIFVSEVNDGVAHDFSPCLASDCMMWEPEYELVKKEIGVEDEVPEGWVVRRVNLAEKTRTIQSWSQIEKGDCGLKAKECGGN